VDAGNADGRLLFVVGSDVAAGGVALLDRAGVAAAGFHAITMILLPLAPLYFISAWKFRGWRVPMLIVGLGMIALGPAVYYGYYNRWTQNSGGIVPGVVGEPAPDANVGCERVELAGADR
jgi:hypothetical protein